jgi:hypothetical protein
LGDSGRRRNAPVRRLAIFNGVQGNSCARTLFSTGSLFLLDACVPGVPS